MNAEENEFIVQDGSASLEFSAGSQYRKVNLRGITIRSIMRDNGEWLEASSDGGRHFGYGRSIEAAIASLLARALDVSPDEEMS